MRRITIIAVLILATPCAIHAQKGVWNLPYVTVLYTNPVEAMTALVSTNVQSAWNGYYSFVVIGRPGIPILLEHAFNTNKYHSLAHLSYHSSNSRFDATIGIVSLYLIEAILHKCANPHDVATVHNTNHYSTDLTCHEYSNVVTYYQAWWRTYSTCTLDFIRKEAINPLEGTYYKWELYTNYMHNPVVQLSE
jgi:hypothetical protein